MTRTCWMTSCDDPVDARGLCNRHYLQFWSRGQLPSAPKVRCLVCRRSCDGTAGRKLCSLTCERLRESMMASRRRGVVSGQRKAYLRLESVRDKVRELLAQGYVQVPRRSPSSRIRRPHFATWRVGHVYLIRWYCPTEQREEAA